MDKKMTLEQVRDGMRAFYKSGEHAPDGSLRTWANAIDAEIKSRGEPVAWVSVDHSVPNWFAFVWQDKDEAARRYAAHVSTGDYLDPELIPLYAAPPAPKIEVTDALARRVVCEMFGYSTPEKIQLMRAALEAALQDTTMTDKLADALREANDLLCDFQSHFGVLPPDDKDDRAAWDRIERCRKALAEHDAQPAQAAQPVGVPDGWRVIPYSGSVGRDDDRWEVYDPTGSGGVVRYDDVRSVIVRDLLDALAAAPQPPAQPSADAGGRFPEPLTHTYKPHPRYPWFCEECGYPEDERLKHRAAEGDE